MPLKKKSMMSQKKIRMTISSIKMIKSKLRMNKLPKLTMRNQDKHLHPVETVIRGNKDT